MRSKMIVAFIFLASLSVFAGASAAQRPAPPPPDQSAQSQQQGPVTMPPDMMQMMGPTIRLRDAGARGHEPGGPLQGFSRLMTALDDPRARAMVGITDQQADSLRKIIVDTETFTIRTGADIAVNSIELRELLRADKPDRTAVTAKGDAVSKDTSQLISHFLDAMLSAKALLTPEQQKAIRAYMESGAPPLPPPTPRP